MSPDDPPPPKNDKANPAVAELLRLLAAGFEVETWTLRSVGGPDDNMEATVELRKGTTTRVLTPQESSFVSQVYRFHESLDAQGDPRSRRFRDNNQYWEDTKRLATEWENEKKALGERIRRGDKLKGGLLPLLTEFLRSRDWGNERFLPLKEQVHELQFEVAYTAKKLLNDQKTLVAKFPESKRYMDEAERVLDAVWQREPNFFKRALGFLAVAPPDTFYAIQRALRQAKHVDHVSSLLAQRRKRIPGDVGMPYVLDAYRRTAESIRPFVFSISDAIRLVDRSPPLDPKLGYSKRVAYIKRTRFAPLVDCLDPAIRHSESHDGTVIDHEAGRITLTDVDWKGTRTVVGDYTYWQIVDMENTIRRGLFPGLVAAFAVHEVGILAVATHTMEFMRALVSIGNLDE